MSTNSEAMPEGSFSLLDTDLYKLTMQCAVLKYFPKVEVGYNFTNRTSHMHLNQASFQWLRKQIEMLETVAIKQEELKWLQNTCPYFPQDYLSYLKAFRFRPKEQVIIDFKTLDGESDSDENAKGNVSLQVKGLWLETILWEIPLLALVSEAYFKFTDTDWSHEGQVEKARDKGLRLLEAGCAFSEFGSRRRRDYKTHGLIVQGLCEAQESASRKGFEGKFAGTSNVHFAMRFGVAPVGTVAHEWFMGVAAIYNDYSIANEQALKHWIGTFGRGVLGIALTDTFGTHAFLDAFKKPAPESGTTDDYPTASAKVPTYAEIFTGTRQDSGDPLEFLKIIKHFYNGQKITEKKTVVYSDALDVDKCIKYKDATEEAGLTPSFGVGTFFTNDFRVESTGEKSAPLNIVMKLAEAEGRPVVKLSDNAGKNTGDSNLVSQVKQQVGYRETLWVDGDEAHRWDKS
ncbi:nicotinate phosphoribosyltransferase [Polychaeton citri CBS 116435]|uniref:Nicotinate phosphoribosyltransferase n=1 Tax=Polychaeton citri CBS 116435 TaxID=1314669 RepID=A0A9P4Q0I7_9PEZI|nr:nicotinate phosphoribosyltransferase [Polychaeton citri CBS 116435]